MKAGMAQREQELHTMVDSRTGLPVAAPGESYRIGSGERPDWLGTWNEVSKPSAALAFKLKDRFGYK